MIYSFSWAFFRIAEFDIGCLNIAAEKGLHKKKTVRIF